MTNPGEMVSPFAFRLHDLYHNPSYRAPLKDVRELHERFGRLQDSYRIVIEQRSKADEENDMLRDELAQVATRTGEQE